MSALRARCVVRRDGELLVEEAFDPDEGRYYRPPGRKVPGSDASGNTSDGDESRGESGGAASAERALRREFADLLGVTLTDLRELGTFDGVRVFEGDVEENWLYDEEGFTVFDPASGETTRVCWLHRDDFEKYGETLRPQGLLDAVSGDVDSSG